MATQASCKYLQQNQDFPMSPNPFDRFIESIRRSDTPFTMFLLLATVAAFTISLFNQGAAYLVGAFGFVAPSHLAQPWRMFTYPVLTLFPDILGLLFNGLGLWFLGGSLERSWSTRGFAAFWLALSAVTALSMSLGAAIAGGALGVGAFLPIAAMFITWAMLNPEMTIHFYGIIPVKAKWMALGTALYLFFSYAAVHPTLGFFALGGSAFGFWWTRFVVGSSPFSSFSGRMGGGYPAPPRQDTFFGGAGKPSGSSSPRGANGSNGPKKPKKILTPLDDKKTWKDMGPLAAYQRYRRRKQFERLLDDE